MKRTEIFEKYYQRLINLEYGCGEHWEKKLVSSYEDLWAVGISSDSKFVIAITGDERLIFSLESYKLLRREDLKYGEEYVSSYDFSTTGFGPCNQKYIPMVSIYGGGLTKKTVDDWTLDHTHLIWPHQEMLLIKIGRNEGISKAHKVCPINSHLVGYGFSENGTSFIVAARDSLIIYGRKNEPPS